MTHPPEEKAVLLLLVGCAVSLLAAPPQPRAAAITVFAGARLIAGDGRAPLEDSAFVVENDRFTRVGRKGELQAPPGATRVDLTGKTVIPALVDAHSHIGYMKDLDQRARELHAREHPRPPASLRLLRRRGEPGDGFRLWRAAVSDSR